MGFLGLIHASKLAAIYDIDIAELTLSAEGTALEATYGYEFRPVPERGLTYSLEAWTGPLTGKKAPYSYSQSFQLSRFPFPREVFIKNADHPEGIPIKVQVGGFVGPPPPSTADASADKSAAQLQNEGLSPPQDVLNVLYGQPFNIKERAETPKFGSVEIKFDPQFLVLNTAGIKDSDIVWKFDSLQTGTTQVVVLVYGGIAKYVRTIVYTVRIFVLPLEPGPVIITGETQQPNATESRSHVPMIIGFLGRVEIARRKVLEKYPTAALYYVQASTKNPRGVNCPYGLTHMEVIFRLHNGVASVTSIGYDEFGPIEVRQGPIVGNANIDWPVSMDATIADGILKEQGHTGNYYALALRKPLFPGVDEDYYIFSMVHGPEVSIETKGHKVAF
ncbi:hypothetical protein PSPO01_15551 [Paraphaeosphaeria sporulosa]